MAANINLPFPAEIRDMINCFVFKHHNPILLLSRPAVADLPTSLSSSHPIPDIGVLTLCPFYHAEGQ
jgi:hypothetical protein